MVVVLNGKENIYKYMELAKTCYCCIKYILKVHYRGFCHSFFTTSFQNLPDVCIVLQSTYIPTPLLFPWLNIKYDPPFFKIFWNLLASISKHSSLLLHSSVQYGKHALPRCRALKDWLWTLSRMLTHAQRCETLMKVMFMIWVRYTRSNEQWRYALRAYADGFFMPDGLSEFLFRFVLCFIFLLKVFYVD